MKSNSERRKKTPRRKKKPFILGLGLDARDQHVRITRGPNYQLVGGSQDTHEQMQETAVKFNEELSRRGKQLEQIGPQEFQDIIEKVK